MRRSIEESSPDSSADGSYATVVEVRQFTRATSSLAAATSDSNATANANANTNTNTNASTNTNTNTNANANANANSGTHTSASAIAIAIGSASSSGADLPGKRSQLNIVHSNLSVSVADENDNNILRAFSPPELPAPNLYRDLHQGSASSSNSSICSEGTQIWVPPLDPKAAFQAAMQPRLGQLSASSSATSQLRRVLEAQARDPYHALPLQPVAELPTQTPTPTPTTRRVTVDVHCPPTMVQADQSSPADSSPRSSVIASVSQSASPVPATLSMMPAKVSPTSAFSTGSSNNVVRPQPGGPSTVSGLLPFGLSHGNAPINESASSSAIAQFEIQPLPQLHFVNKLELEHNSILELRQVSTSSNGSNNTNMINVDSGISNTSPETQSSTELFHPVSHHHHQHHHHPSRHFADGHRVRPFPLIAPTMLSSIPSSASGAIVQSTSPSEFLSPEQFQQPASAIGVGVGVNASVVGGDSRVQQAAFGVGVVCMPGTPVRSHSHVMLRRCASMQQQQQPQPQPQPETNANSSPNAPLRAPHSILKANVSSMPAVQMQIAFKTTLFRIISLVYCIALCSHGALFPLIESAAGRLDASIFEQYFVVVYTFGICFLGYVYVFLLRERDVGKKVQKARLFLRTNLLTQRRSHVLRSAGQSAVDAIALQSLNDSNETNITYGHDISKQSRSLDGVLIRLTVVLLGFAGIVHDGLEFVHRIAINSGVFSANSRNSTTDTAPNITTTECSGIAFAARPLLQLCFVFVQLYFIFLNSKVRIQRYQALARFGLAHMLACNFCILILAFFNQVSGEYSRLNANSAKSEIKQLNLCFVRHGAIGDVLSRVSPYLFYCVVGYCLYAIAILTTMWNNVGRFEYLESSLIAEPASETSGNCVAASVPSERNSVHFFDQSSGQVEEHAGAVMDYTRSKRNFHSAIRSMADAQHDGADSSSSSGMSDSDSESNLSTPGATLANQLSSMNRPPRTLLPPAIRGTLVQQQPIRHLHSPVGVETVSSSSATFTRGLMKQAPQQVRSVDCDGAHRGLFFGLFVLVVTLVNLIVFNVLIQKAEFVSTAFTVHYVFEISMHLVSVASMIIGFYKMQDMLYLPIERSGRLVSPFSHSMFSDNLIGLGQVGIIILVCFNFVATSFAFETRSNTFLTPNAVLPSYQTVVLFLCSNVVNLLQSVCQSVFVVTGLRRMSYKILHKQEKPGRDYVTFLILYNLSMYLVELFELQRMLLLVFTVNYYGVIFWLVLVHISIPLVVFYRLQSTLCFIRIWKTAYKFKSN